MQTGNVGGDGCDLLLLLCLRHLDHLRRPTGSDQEIERRHVLHTQTGDQPMLRVEGLEELRLQLPLRQCGRVAPIRHPDEESVIGRLEVEEVDLSRP